MKRNKKKTCGSDVKTFHWRHEASQFDYNGNRSVATTLICVSCQIGGWNWTITKQSTWQQPSSNQHERRQKALKQTTSWIYKTLIGAPLHIDIVNSFDETEGQQQFNALSGFGWNINVAIQMVSAHLMSCDYRWLFIFDIRFVNFIQLLEVLFLRAGKEAISHRMIIIWKMVRLKHKMKHDLCSFTVCFRCIKQ